MSDLSNIDPTQKQQARKMARILIKIETKDYIPKPDWIRIRVPATMLLQK